MTGFFVSTLTNKEVQHESQQGNYNMKLTLKKPEVNKMKKSDTPKIKRSLFKHLEITPCGVRTIGLVQSEFESLWKRIDLIYGSPHEKNRALDHMREACMWMCRAVANYNEVKIDIKENSPEGDIIKTE